MFFKFVFRRSLYINDAGLLIILSLACLSGLVMFAIYHDCDPLKNKEVSKSDQVVMNC